MTAEERGEGHDLRWSQLGFWMNFCLVLNEVESVEVYVIKYKQSSQVMNFVLLIHLSLGW